MRSITKPVAWTLWLALAVCVLATHHASAAELKTSKERLSSKAADEQRVDNCRVPPDQRGSAPRPDCDREGESSRPAPNPTRDGADRNRP